MKLLIIEDDENILSFLKRGFLEDGYIVDSANDGEDGEYLASINNYDVIILDWMLPSKNGIDILKSLRDKKITTPTIILSAKNEVQNRISGLNIGADDYLSKPFSFEELQARVEALNRRNISQGVNTVEIGKLIIDIDSKVIKVNNEIVKITSKEYELLLFLIKNKNSVVSNSMIEDQLWSNQEYISSNIIQVMIYNLRKKFGKDFVQSFRGLGYKIDV